MLEDGSIDIVVDEDDSLMGSLDEFFDQGVGFKHLSIEEHAELVA